MGHEMLMQELNKKVNAIEMPDEMQERIVRNCYVVTEEEIMNKSTAKKSVKKPMVAAASVVLCLSLTGITALAGTGKLQGFFKDVKRWDGAVIGTTYEQATEEIEVSVVEATDTLTVAVTMIDPKVAPYRFFETFGVESYKIVDADGNVVVNSTATKHAEVIDGKVKIVIPLENIPNGEYKLVVDQLVGSAKADQPLVISGTWECEFVH